jgi:predicted RNase H-like nuclease
MLDALVAAYTAWLTAHQPDGISLIGDPKEGQIVLPVSEVKSKY